MSSGWRKGKRGKVWSFVLGRQRFKGACVPKRGVVCVCDTRSVRHKGEREKKREGGVPMNWNKSREQRAKSQQIVATRLLFCLQYPVPCLSRLQRIYLTKYLLLIITLKAGMIQKGHRPPYSYAPKIWRGRNRCVLAGILT